MKSRVAILSVRPETIADDYRRLLQLAGLWPGEFPPWDLMAVAARGGSWQPGRDCPPWQVHAALQALGEGSGLLALTDKGPAAARGRWSALLADSPVHPWSADTLERSPYRAAQPVPSLESSLEKGLQLSPHLRERRPLLLTPVSLAEGGLLQAAVAWLARWLAPERRRSSKIPEAEVLAEVVALAAELFPGLGIICDATVLGVRRRSGARVTLDRNLLVAGKDPVAVDAVLARLTGSRPASLPWLRLAQQRQVGNSAADRIEVLGDPHLMDLDFQIPEDSFAAGKGGLLSRILPTRTDADDSAVDRSAGDSPWQRLHDDFQTGAVS